MRPLALRVRYAAEEMVPACVRGFIERNLADLIACGIVIACPVLLWLAHTLREMQ